MLALLIGTIGALVQSVIADRASSDSVLLEAVMTAGIAITISLLLLLCHITEQTRRQSRFTIRYYPGETPTEIEKMHRQASKVVQRAAPGAEIYAVSSCVEVGGGPLESTAERVKRAYLREIELKLDHVSYHRLIQLRAEEPDSGRTLASLISPAYLDHYQATLRHARKDHRRLIKIEEVDVKFPHSFVLLKNGAGGEIIWQINQYAPQDGQSDTMRITGMFLISDADGVLVPHFLDWFRILDSGHATPVNEADLRR